MRRLGIFCLYAQNEIVRYRVTYLLKELSTVLDELVIVSNGMVNDEGMHILHSFTDTVIIRDNIGFDGGAVCDILLNYIGRDELKQWDAFVICNDTFWGPFIPFTYIFDRMDGKEVDYWGLNRVEAGFLSYIQSYFICFNKRLLQEEVLIDFFEERRSLMVEQDLYGLYVKYELALTYELERRGFHGDTFVFTENNCIYESPAYCSMRFGLPLLKCKAFDPIYHNKNQILLLLNDLRARSLYDVGEIIMEVEERYGVYIDIEELPETTNLDFEKPIYTTIPEYDEDEIVAFAKQFSKIYLYGSGLIGQKIWHTIGDMLGNVAGFLVSDEVEITQKEVMGLSVMHYQDRHRDAGVIVTLDRRNAKQVYGIHGNDGRMLYLFRKYNVVVSM